MVVHVKETAKKCTKKCDAGAKLLFYLLNLLFFLFFFLFSLHLKLPNQSGFLGGDGKGRGGGGSSFFNHFAEPPQLF